MLNQYPSNEARRFRESLTIFLAVIFLHSCFTHDKKDIDSLIDQGDIAFAKGMYGDALNAWNKAFKIDGENDRLILRIAKALQKQGHFNQSTQLLKRILSKPEPPLNAFYMMAQNEIMASNFDDAGDVFETVRRLTKPDSRLLMLEGDYQTLMGRLNEGEALYRKSIEIKGINVEAHFKLAANLIVQKKPEAADKIFQNALKLEQKISGRFSLHKAEYLTLTGDIIGAELVLKEGLNNDPENIFIKLKTAQLYKIVKKNDAIKDLFLGTEIFEQNEEIQKIVTESFLDTRKLPSAYKILVKYERSNDSDWLLLFGKYYLLMGDNTNAVSYTERALEKDRDDPRSLYLLALAYLAGDKINLAQQTLIQLLSIAPFHVNGELALADVYYKKMNYDLSISHLKRVIARNPENFRAYLILGNCMLATENLNQAEINFKKSSALDENSLDARYYLATAKGRQGDDKTAIMLFKRILEKDPKRVEAALRLSEIYIENKNNEEAIDYLQTLIKRNPNSGYLKFILGKTLQDIKDPELAFRYYKLALKNDPSLDQAYKKLIDIAGTDINKIEILRDATKKLPQSIELKLILSSLYLKENDLNSAINLMEELYSGDKTNAVFANNLAWLYLESNTNNSQAFELASFAYGTDSDNVYFAHTLGVAFHKKGLLQQAEWYLRKALSLIDEKKCRQPTGCFNKDIVDYHLALLLMEMEQNEESKKRLLSIIDGNLPKKYTTEVYTLLNDKFNIEISQQQ